MSVRREVEALEPSISKMLEAIHEFNDVVRERVLNHNWSQDHIDRLSILRNRLNDLEIELSYLKSETW